VVKPIHQRNFSIDKGDLLKTFMSYDIDRNGLECILILNEYQARVNIVVDDGEVESLGYGNKYIKKDTFNEKEKEDLRNAKKLYEEVKKILNVKEELKNYNYNLPEEEGLFPFMKIKNASQIKNYFLD